MNLRDKKTIGPMWTPTLYPPKKMVGGGGGGGGEQLQQTAWMLIDLLARTILIDTELVRLID